MVAPDIRVAPIKKLKEVIGITITGKKHDWESLERKLSKGLPLEEAARQAGIPITACYLYIKKKEEERKTLDFELRKVGQEALKIALTKLIELAEGPVREGEHFESTDLLAARELARTAIATLKMSKEGKVVKEGGDKDLFDLASEDPWVLKEIT